MIAMLIIFHIYGSVKLPAMNYIFIRSQFGHDEHVGINVFILLTMATFNL